MLVFYRLCLSWVVPLAQNKNIQTLKIKNNLSPGAEGFTAEFF